MCWGIYASIEKWDYCLEIGSAMVRLDPARFTGWINRSFALHCLKRTKEAYEQLKEGLRRLLLVKLNFTILYYKSLR